MNRTNLVITGVAIFFGLGLVVAAVLWIWLGTPTTDEGPITAIPLQVNTAPAATAENIYGSTEGAPTAVAAATNAAPTDAPAAGGLTIYSINSSESSATFTIHETLRGSPQDVVGTNNQIAG